MAAQQKNNAAGNSAPPAAAAEVVNKAQTVVQNAAQKAQDVLNGNSNLYNSVKTDCTDAFKDLSIEQKLALQKLRRHAPLVYDNMKSTLGDLVGKARAQVQSRNSGELDIVKLTALLNKTAECLRDPSTKQTVLDAIKAYDDVVEKHPDVRKALGAYVQCLTVNMDGKNKAAVLAMINVVTAAMALVNDPKIKSAALNVLGDVKRDAKNVANNASKGLGILPNSFSGMTGGAGSSKKPQTQTKATRSGKGSGGRPPSSGKRSSSASPPKSSSGRSASPPKSSSGRPASSRPHSKR